MAIYHLSCQIINRGDGRSAVAAAAYRAGEKLVSQYDGTVSDYTHKDHVVYSNIMLPGNAPEAFKDRETLWNSVELSSSSKERLAREFTIALPHELSLEQQVSLIEDYVQQTFVSVGMVADIAIHNPPLRDDSGHPLNAEGNPARDESEWVFQNPHAHVMLTLRPIAENGKWEAKFQKAYVCRRNNEEEQNFTAAEFKQARQDGWAKQYSYVSDGKKMWMTDEQGQAAGLVRSSNNPKSVSIENTTAAYWNATERMEEWRKDWEVMVNERLKAIGSEERIDHRSYARQGLDITPTLHMGPAATAIEKRADREIREGKLKSEVQRSDIGNINRTIMEERRLKKLLFSAVRSIERAAEQAQKAAQKSAEAARTTVSAAARKLEHIRGQVIGLEYYDRKAADILKDLDSSNEKMQKAIDADEHVKTVIRNAQNSIQDCENILKSGKPSHSVREAMQTRISQCRDIIERQTEVLAETLRSLGFRSESDYSRQRRYHEQRQEQAAKMRNGMDKIHDAEEAQLSAYNATLRDAPEEHEKAVAKERERIRPEEEHRIEEKLRKEDGEEFSEERYLDALDAAARKLDMVEIEKHLNKDEMEYKEIKRNSYPRS